MKKLIFLLGLIAVLLLGFVGCSGNDDADNMKETDDMAMTETMNKENDMDLADDITGYTDITPMKAKEMIDMNPDMIIIDVSPLYDEGHIPGAVNYFVGDGSLDTAIPMLDKNATYLVYCHTDEASILGATKLVEAGFMNVYRLEGNYGAWVDAGYMVEMMNTYKDVTPAEAKMIIDTNPDLIIIDVSPAYADGHLPGAVNYYLGDGSLDDAILMLDKEAMYLVYCHVESVSRQGAQKLIDAGFKNVYRLDGDYSAWVNAGYPIEK